MALSCPTNSVAWHNFDITREKKIDKKFKKTKN